MSPSVRHALAVPYLSEAWAEACLEAVEDDPRILAATKGAKVSLLCIILNPPPERYGFIYVAFDDAGLADYRLGHDYATVTKDMPTPTFVVSGDYKIWAQVQDGELPERKAVMSGKLHLTGNLLKALKHMRALEALTAVLRDIECET